MNSNFLRTFLLSISLAPFFLATATSEEGGEEETSEVIASADVNTPSEKTDAEKKGLTYSTANSEAIKKINLALKELSKDYYKASQDEVMNFFKFVMQKVVENNKDLRKARAEVLALMGNNNLARGEFLPDLEANAGYKGSSKYINKKENGISNNLDHNNKEWGGDIGLDARWNLFNGGASAAQLKIANNETRAKFEAYKDLEAETILKAFQLLLNIIAYKIIVKQSEANVLINEETLKSALEKLKIGEIDRVDVGYADFKTGKAMAKLEEAKIKLSGFIGDFQLASGISDVEIKAIIPNFESFLPKAFEEMEKVAERENPKILSVNYAAVASKAEISKELAGYLPKVNLEGRVGRVDSFSRENLKTQGSSSYTRGHKMNSYGPQYSAGISVRVPLDIKCTTNTRITGARHKYVQAKVNGAQTRSKVLSDIKTHFCNLDNKKKIIELWKRNAKANEESVQCYLQRLAVGDIVHEKVLVVQADVYECYVDLANAYREYAETQLHLLYSMGRLNPKVFGAVDFNFDPYNNKSCRSGEIEKIARTA
jgi:outer membrane protein TolC